MSARRGQSIIEYTIIIGIVALVLSYMGTGIKRGVQSVVKVTADQIGNQQNSDQDFNDVTQGYMQYSNTETQEVKNKQVSDVNGMTTTNYSEQSDTLTNSYTNGGFQQSN